MSLPLLSLVCWVFVIALSESQDQAIGITNIRTYRGANYDSDCHLVKREYRVRIQTRKQHYGKEGEKISLEEM